MTQLNVAFLIIGTVASFTGVLVAAIKLLGMVKARWIDDQKNNETIRENTEAIKQLTQSVKAQTAQLSDLEARVRVIESSRRG